MDREEVETFLKIWASTMVLLCYCYSIAASVPKGILRLVSLLPVIYLITVLPLGLSSCHLAMPTTVLLVWLCNFKLLLFSFGSGPLARSPSLLHFVLVASLPIRIKQDNLKAAKSDSPSEHNHGVALSAVKLLLLVLIFQAYNYKPYLHFVLVWGLYCLHGFLETELILAIYAVPAKLVLGGLGPQFKEPYLTTSLEDFWGRRWNLAASEILRLTVYDPLRCVCVPIMGTELGSYAAVFAAFTVSGFMHEALFYYYTRASPRWEVTVFFLIQGACVVLEKAIKKRFRKTWKPHRVVSGVLTLGFLGTTAIPLFGLPLTRHGIDEKAIRECHEMVGFLKKKVRLIS